MDRETYSVGDQCTVFVLRRWIWGKDAGRWCKFTGDQFFASTEINDAHYTRQEWMRKGEKRGQRVRSELLVLSGALADARSTRQVRGLARAIMPRPKRRKRGA